MVQFLEHKIKFLFKIFEHLAYNNMKSRTSLIGGEITSRMWHLLPLLNNKNVQKNLTYNKSNKI